MKDHVINLIEGVLEESVDLDSNKEDSKNWDSLNHVRIVAEIQEVFEIKIPFSEIDKLNSVKAIIDYLENNN